MTKIHEREKEEIEKRRAQGNTREKIAEEMGISLSSVKRELKKQRNDNGNQIVTQLENTDNQIISEPDNGVNHDKYRVGPSISKYDMSFPKANPPSREPQSLKEIELEKIVPPITEKIESNEKKPPISCNKIQEDILETVEKYIDLKNNVELGKTNFKENPSEEVKLAIAIDEKELAILSAKIHEELQKYVSCDINRRLSSNQ